MHITCSSGPGVKPTSFTFRFSALGIIPQSERSRVQFLVRAHAWIVSLVPGLGQRKPINVSLSHR